MTPEERRNPPLSAEQMLALARVSARNPGGPDRLCAWLASDLDNEWRAFCWERGLS